MNRTKGNAGAASGPTPAQNTRGSERTSQSEDSTTSAVWGASSAGLPFPNPSTCKGQLLAELLTQADVTHRTFDGQVRTMRTAVYVRRLRADGWPIITALVPGSNDFEKVRYAVYSLDPSVPIGAPERAYMALCELAAMEVL